MKKFFLGILTMLLLLNASSSVFAQAEKPDYEKYGSIALAVVKADFPYEAVVDYQYLGRQKISAADVTDTFRFEVKENNKPVIVTVKITHSLNTNKLLSLTVEQK